HDAWHTAGRHAAGTAARNVLSRRRRIRSAMETDGLDGRRTVAIWRWLVNRGSVGTLLAPASRGIPRFLIDAANTLFFSLRRVYSARAEDRYASGCLARDRNIALLGYRRR